MKDHDLLIKIEEHLDGFPDRQREIHEIRSLLFGNKVTGEKGMKEKVDEIHELLIRSKGIVSFFGGIRGVLGFIIVFGAAIALIKGWLR